MALHIPTDIAQKIAQSNHGSLRTEEVAECFLNHAGKFCQDSRPEHSTASGSPTLWFVGETNHGRFLKIMFVRDGMDIYLKSAYPATDAVKRIFAKYAE